MNSRRILAAGAIGVCLAMTLVLVAFAQSRGAATKRVQPPKFDKEKAASVFFDDVFAKVTGERPKSFKGLTQSKPGVPGAVAGDNLAGSGGGFAWSKIISSATLEDEVKNLKLDLDKNITTPSDFAGRGHKPVRRDLSTLAFAFGIIGEFDGDVRWKKDAPVIRDIMARTAANAKAGGNTQVYNEAKARKSDLEDLMGGNAPSGKEAEPAATWNQVCDRAPLMQRLEAAFDAKVATLLANETEFKKNKETLRHESEMIAAISEVLGKSGMEDADDDVYKAYAVSMKKASLEIIDAVKLDGYGKAREAAGAITKACSDCHEKYRG